MLTGNLVLVRTSKDRLIPQFLSRESDVWLEAAESLLLIYRSSIGQTRGQIQDEVESLIGEGGGYTLFVNRGLAKVLEDRAQFEVVADVAPDEVREKVFSAAAEYRRSMSTTQPRAPFDREAVLSRVAAEMNITSRQVDTALFADLKDENLMISFEDMTAQALIDRYNVALVQSVLLRATAVRIELRGETPATYRQIFRMLKFHRLLARVEGTMQRGYRLHIDGPLSLFSSTTKYGFQMAMFFPAVLLARSMRLEAEVRWGPKREPRMLILDGREGLVTHHRPQGVYVPEEVKAFVERFRQIAPDWDLDENAEVVELGGEDVWIPDYRFIHRPSGVEVYAEVLGFWKRANLERLLRLLPKHGPPRYLLAISQRMKVDEANIDDLRGPVLRFKDMPNATELRELLASFI
jgi:predicted nuclease of restriction endonuclease-like RecB superfamily